MDRPQLKAEMRQLLNSHFTFFLLMFLPVIILNFGSSWVGFAAQRPGNIYWQVMNGVDGGAGFVMDAHDVAYFYSALSLIWIIGVLASLLMVGMQFASLDLIRHKATFEQPVTKSFTIFNKGQYFIGTIMIGILITVFTFLWSFLLVIPGIIKGFAYSQAFFIYKDAVDQGKPISYLEAITQSREMMNGHKMDYFVLLLSFIGWQLLTGLTMGILSLWVTPYYQLSLTNFYVQLADDDPEDLTTIFDNQNES